MSSEWSSASPTGEVEAIREVAMTDGPQDSSDIIAAEFDAVSRPRPDNEQDDAALPATKLSKKEPVDCSAGTFDLTMVVETDDGTPVTNKQVTIKNGKTGETDSDFETKACFRDWHPYLS